jgi:hypothetical protein
MASTSNVIISGVIDDDTVLSKEYNEYEDEEDKGRGGMIMTMMGSINSGGDIKNIFEEDNFTGDDFKLEGLDKEVELLFLEVSCSIIGQEYSPLIVRLDMVMLWKLMHFKEQMGMVMQRPGGK